MPNPLIEALTRVATGLQSAAPAGLNGRLWEEVRPWLALLMSKAAPKWVPRLSFGFPCQVPVYRAGAPVAPCAHHAIAACDACGKACCLYHARIDHLGDAICMLCVSEAVQNKRGTGAAPTPPCHDLAWARKILGVKADTEWSEVHDTYRTLSKKWHPDLHKTEKQKLKATEKFKLIQEAYALLKADHDKKAAA